MRGKRRDRLLPERRQSQVWAQPLRPAGRRPWPPLGGASLPRGTAGSPKRTEGAKGYGGDQGFIKKRAGCGDRVSSQRREGGVALHHQGARRRREKEKEPSCCDSPLSSLCLFVTTLSLSLSLLHWQRRRAVRHALQTARALQHLLRRGRALLVQRPEHQAGAALRRRVGGQVVDLRERQHVAAPRLGRDLLVVVFWVGGAFVFVSECVVIACVLRVLDVRQEAQTTGQ